MSESIVEVGRNFFLLFGLTPQFDIDGQQLAERYRELQRQVHPDRFANASDAERRLALQQASWLNEGYQTLRQPLSRARYLLEQLGVAFNERDTQMDPAFLMTQMELRERLAAVPQADDPLTALTRLHSELEQHWQQLLASLRSDLAQADAEALQRARDQVRRLQFLDRLRQEIDQLEEELAHAI